MRRRLLSILSALSLALCLSAAGLWGATCFCSGTFGGVGRDFTAYVYLHGGAAALYFCRTDRNQVPQWIGGIWKTWGAPHGPEPGDFNWSTLSSLVIEICLETWSFGFGRSPRIQQEL